MASSIFYFFAGMFCGFGAYRLLVLMVRRKRMNYPVTEIHVKKVEVDALFNRLKQYCLKHPKVMLMLTVKNWKPSIRSLIVERYKRLAKLGNPIGLHVHLAISPEIDALSLEKQKQLIEKSKRFLETKLDINIDDFAPGWWSFNDDTLKTTKKLGITNFHYFRTLVYAPRLIDNFGLTPIEVRNYLHDWNFVDSEVK